MNKKLIALAIAAALPVAAYADVTLYGKIKMGVENTKVGEGASTNRIDDYGSRIGFKGNEDLGNGLKTIWQVESKVSADGTGTETKTFGTRQTFVGLEGGFGKVRVGYLNNSLNDIGVLDAWEYGDGANGLGTYTRAGHRVKNAVRYDSPEFAGFTFNVGHGLGEGYGTANKYESFIGLDYANSGFFGHYAYNYQAKQNLDGNKAADNHMLEVGYDANNLFVGLGYLRTKSYLGYGTDATGKVTSITGAWFGTGSDKLFDLSTALGGAPGSAASKTYASNVKLVTDEVALTVAYTMGAFTPKASYVKGWDVKADGSKLNNSGYQQYVIGADYALSKRTVAGFAYGKLDFHGKDADISTFGANLVHAF